MPKRISKKTEDPYIGIKVNGLTLTEKVGEGGIGVVYKALGDTPRDVFACKIIPEGSLKKGWERELEKLKDLKRLPNIVQYYNCGNAFNNESRPFTFIIFDFINGIDLRQYLAKPIWPLDMAFIEVIAETLLTVLHACRAVNVSHGDLHEGNIMIEEPDPRRIDNQRVIWVTDFGYGGSHNDIEPKDDFKQTFSILSRLLRRLDPAALNPRDKMVYAKLKEFLDKQLLEKDPTQGPFVGSPKALLQVFKELTAQRETVEGTLETLKRPGDYLWAEALGFRADEWQSLFVPEFLAAQQILSKDITVLTGARGCGKTMSFRRLTAYMDKVIGAPSGVPGADQFTGFYLNCREFAEAFPWLPQELNEAAERQIIHYFHLAC